MKLSGFSCLCVALGFCSVPANAATIFNNGVPDLSAAISITINRSADNFTLGGPATVAAIRFWALSDGTFSSAFDGIVTWAIYNDSSGSLGTLVSSGTVGNLVGVPDATFCCAIFPVNVIDFNLGSPLALSTGTYWLELHEGSSLMADASTPSQIYWETSNGLAGDSKQGSLANPPSTHVNVELAFQLFDTASVPEPTTWILVVAPLAAILRFRHGRT